jgi:hypothetical protein
MDSSFLKEQADRCRRLADNADQFTKRRLLDLAEKYEDRLPLSAEANAFVAAISTAVVLACVGETFGKLPAAWIE